MDCSTEREAPVAGTSRSERRFVAQLACQAADLKTGR